MGRLPERQVACIAQSQFDVLLTVDKNIPYQQNMGGRSIVLLIVEAKDNTVPTLATAMPDVLALLPTILPGQVYRVQAIVPEVASEDTGAEQSAGSTTQSEAQDAEDSA